MKIILILATLPTSTWEDPFTLNETLPYPKHAQKTHQNPIPDISPGWQLLPVTLRTFLGPCKGGGSGIQDSNFKQGRDSGFRFQSLYKWNGMKWSVMGYKGLELGYLDPPLQGPTIGTRNIPTCTCNCSGWVGELENTIFMFRLGWKTLGLSTSKCVHAGYWTFRGSHQPEVCAVCGCREWKTLLSLSRYFRRLFYWVKN